LVKILLSDEVRGFQITRPALMQEFSVDKKRMSDWQWFFSPDNQIRKRP